MNNTMNNLFKRIPHYYKASYIYYKDSKNNSVEIHISSFTLTNQNKIVFRFFSLLTMLSKTKYKDVHMHSHLFTEDVYQRIEPILKKMNIKFISIETRKTPKYESIAISIISKIKRKPVDVNSTGAKIHLRLP